MEYTLENSQIKAKVASQGAELKSLFDKVRGKELMWQADPAFWGRTAPVLFPQVGKVIDDTYRYEGKEYHLPQHGFARDREFELESQTETELWFSLWADADSKKVYPFEFQLEIGYRLEEKALRVFWRVMNPDGKTLYFAIGGHPAFNCPINGEDGFEGYYLDFHTDKAVLQTEIFGTGYVTDQKGEVQLEPDGTIRITEELMSKDALIFENRQTQAVSLMTPDKERYLTVRFDAPLFGVWTPPGKHAPFLCIEPWYGRADRESFSGTLQEREWEQKLDAKEVFEASFTIQPE